MFYVKGNVKWRNGKTYLFLSELSHTSCHPLIERQIFIVFTIFEKLFVIVRYATMNYELNK